MENINLQPELRILFDNTVSFSDANKMKILDDISKMMSSPCVEQTTYANKLWETLKNDATFWENTPDILKYSTYQLTKLLALICMEEAIQVKWASFPKQNQEQVKQFVFQNLLSMGSMAPTKDHVDNQNRNQLLQKFRSILIAIVKYEMNSGWKSFITEICMASQQNEFLCENNLILLTQLSEEIFDYSKNQMTSSKIQQLKQSMTDEFKHVYELCFLVATTYLQNKTQVKPALMKATLDTLYSFLSWIPLPYIFLTDLIQIILMFLDEEQYRDISIQCLTEIVILNLNDDNPPEQQQQMKMKVLDLYNKFIQKLEVMVPLQLSLTAERQKLQHSNPKGLKQFDDFCQKLGLFFTGFFSTHISWIEDFLDNNNSQDSNIITQIVHKGLSYLINLNDLPEENIFKIIVEFWHKFTIDLVSKQQTKIQPTTQPLFLSNQVKIQLSVYPQILSQVRQLITGRMAKPEEVLIVVDEYGQPCREEQKNTENNTQYEMMKELLINLTKLNSDNMKGIMLKKLDAQFDGSEWSYDALNSLCWAIGSINGTLPENEEKAFLIQTIRTLLNLVETKKGKENKAIVASNIMYVVGQYPKFLKANWNFLKTVVKKLFEFMRETFPGVMEMAVNTFKTISIKCKEEFVAIQQTKDDQRNDVYDQEPYIQELIRKTPELIYLLDQQQKYIFYESLGYMISAAPIKEQELYLQDLLKDYLLQFSDINHQLDNNNVAVLQEEGPINNLVNFLKINENLAFSTGYSYLSILIKIVEPLLRIYGLYTRIIQDEIQKNGVIVVNWHSIKKVRTIRRQFLKLLITFIKHCQVSLPIFMAELTMNCLQPSLELILSDYINTIPEIREPEVLLIFAISFENLSNYLQGIIPSVLQGIFDSTLSMITADFSSYPEIRTNFFTFLKSVTTNAIQQLFTIPPDQFKTMINCVVWAFKHQLSSIFELGLEALLFILNNVNKDQMLANQFYRIYYIDLIKYIFEVLTDGFHKSGFKIECQILQVLFQVVSNGLITVPLSDGQQSTNQEYTFEILNGCLTSVFQLVSKQKTQQYIMSWFQLCNDFKQFKTSISDYLINIKSYQENDQFFNDDINQQQQQQKMAASQNQQQMAPSQNTTLFSQQDQSQKM